MIEERGRVIAVSQGLAEVECERRSSCGSCSVNGACGTSLLERFFGRKQRIVTAHNPVGAETGETVVLGIAESTLLQAAFIAYLLPLSTMLAGAAATVWLADRFAPAWSEGLSALGGLTGLAVGLWWLTGYSARRNGDARFQATILRRGSVSSVEVALHVRKHGIGPIPAKNDGATRVPARLP